MRQNIKYKEAVSVWEMCAVTSSDPSPPDFVYSCRLLNLLCRNCPPSHGFLPPMDWLLDVILRWVRQLTDPLCLSPSISSPFVISPSALPISPHFYSRSWDGELVKICEVLQLTLSPEGRCFSRFFVLIHDSFHFICSPLAWAEKMVLAFFLFALLNDWRTHIYNLHWKEI